MFYRRLPPNDDSYKAKTASAVDNLTCEVCVAAAVAAVAADDDAAAVVDSGCDGDGD